MQLSARPGRARAARVCPAEGRTCAEGAASLRPLVTLRGRSACWSSGGRWAAAGRACQAVEFSGAGICARALSLTVSPPAKTAKQEQRPARPCPSPHPPPPRHPTAAVVRSAPHPFLADTHSAPCSCRRPVSRPCSRPAVPRRPNGPPAPRLRPNATFFRPVAATRRHRARPHPRPFRAARLSCLSRSPRSSRPPPQTGPASPSAGPGRAAPKSAGLRGAAPPASPPAWPPQTRPSGAAPLPSTRMSSASTRPHSAP